MDSRSDSVPSVSSQTFEKPAKKVIDSAIRTALKIKDEAEKLGKETHRGLLSFWRKGTEAEKKNFYKMHDDISAENQSKLASAKKHDDATTKVHIRELARIRKQKQRKKLKEVERASGLRSPGGTKRKSVGKLQGVGNAY